MDKLKKIWSGLVLVALCGVIVCSRVHTYSEPLERDLTVYAVIAHEMLAGKALYSDLWDHKPPAIHLTYAAAEMIAGYGRNSIFLMSVVAASATLLACYLAGAAGGGWLGGLLAAGLWAVASGDLALQANQPNTEVFLNAFLASAFAIFVRVGSGNLGTRRALLVGALFAIASLYKQVVIAQAALVSFAYLACSPRGSRKKALLDVGIIAAVGILAWASVIGYFYARGRGAAFTEAVFVYNRFYASTSWKDINDRTTVLLQLPDALAVLLSLALLAAIGLFLGLIFGPRRQWILLLAFGIATHISVLMPGWFFPHYYQLWLPPLVIGAGWAVTLLRRILPARLTWLSYATAAAAISTLAFMEAPYYRVPAEIWSVKKYGGVFLATDNLARGINHLLLPGETFYEWGNESGLYFITGRRPPSGIIFAYPMQDGPLASALSERVRDDLERTKPELLVVHWDAMKKVSFALPLLNWCKQNYRPFYDTKIFLLLVRKGGRIDSQQAMAAN